MRKKILIIMAIIAIISFFGARYFLDRKEEKIIPPITEKENKEETDNFVACLAEAGMVIYGSKTCPACLSLVNSFGGYEKISPIYVECSQEGERCSQEMQTNFVPEIQIRGEVYQGSRDISALLEAAGCEI